MILLGLVVVLLSFLTSNTALKLGFIGAGVGVLGIGIGLIAIAIANESDRMMHAMASHDFYEKEAVFDRYAAKFDRGQALSAFDEAQFLADLRAAHALLHWAPESQRKELAKSLRWILERASAHPGVGAEWITQVQTLTNEIEG